MANIEVVGIKDTLKDLRTLDPEMRKQFARDAKQIAAPITNEAKGNYPQLPLRGMKYRWRQRGRDLLPWDARRARSGVTLKIDAGRRRDGVITIIQKDPAASITEFASNNNRLGRSLSTLAWGTPARVMWPAADNHLKDVTREMVESIELVAGNINRKIIF